MSYEGHFYEIRYRLRGQLAHHRWKLGKPWTPNQEDAWNLLNEIDQLIKILEQLARSLPPENDSELAQQVRHKLVMHQPAWRADEKREV